MNPHPQQAVGEKFNPAAMHFARDKTWETVHQVAGLIRPGMRESEAAAQCQAVLRDLGMDRLAWSGTGTKAIPARRSSWAAMPR